jgi:hypothetical protein
MTREEHERLYELVQNPPPGSKIKTAKEHGVDLTLNLRSLTRTPAERVREMEAALRFAEELRHAAAHLDQCPPLTSFPSRPERCPRKPCLCST